jgi:hypothetical protein
VLSASRDMNTESSHSQVYPSQELVCMFLDLLFGVASLVQLATANSQPRNDAHFESQSLQTMTVMVFHLFDA